MKPKLRGRGDEPLSSAERTEFRSIIGSLQWIGSMCRPDICADTSLLQSGDIRVADLSEAEKTLRYTRATAETGIIINPIPIDKIVLVPYSDASWGNAPGGRTQAGLLIAATDVTALESPSPASVLEWKSHRLKRATRSTIGSEAAAMDAAVDHGFYLGLMLSEFIVPSFRATEHIKSAVPIFPCTDCKSLYDALRKLQLSVDEKRVLIDINAIKEIVQGDTVRWVPSHLQYADGLTKRSAALRDTFRNWLEKPVISLQVTVPTPDPAPDPG